MSPAAAKEISERRLRPPIGLGLAAMNDALLSITQMLADVA
jgi:hypothetical protein